MPHLEITEVVLVHCNIVNNDYQQDSRVLYTFVPNKLFGSLFEISPTNHIFLKTFNSEYDEIIVWFTDQDSQKLESLSNKYGQKLLDSAKKPTTDAIKTASKRGIQKTAEATVDLIGNNIADKITSVSTELPSKKPNNNNNNNNYEDVELTTHKKRYISLEERKLIIEESSLVRKKNV